MRRVRLIMDLLNEEITHKSFGEGAIIEQDDSFITIDFDEKGVKEFVYPDAFGQFITLKNPNAAETLKEDILEIEKEKEELEKQQQKERNQQALERKRRAELKNHKLHESSQIVFWLDEEDRNVFTDWEVSTGKVQSGQNKGEPKKAARLRPNSAALMTVRKPDEPETQRQILGLYMVDDMFAGNLNENGMVPAHEEFRIKLTEQEAERMLFWDYYINKSYPDRKTWNSGKYRYFDNVWTAQILKDILALKKDEEEIKEVEKFLEYFCKMNALDRDNIPEAAGALKQ